MDNTEEHIAGFIIFDLDVFLNCLRQWRIASLITLHYLSAVLVYNDDMIVFV